MKMILGVGVCEEDANCEKKAIPDNPERVEVRCDSEGTPISAIFFGIKSKSRKVIPCRFNVSLFTLIEKRFSGVMVYIRDSTDMVSASALKY